LHPKIKCSIFVLFGDQFMAQRTFGGRHTEKKLDLIENYLNAYTTALKNQPFSLIYFDAFAGAGEIPQSTNPDQPMLPLDDFKPIIDGSARRALQLDRLFDEYIFTDLGKSNTDQLSKLKTEFPNVANRITIRKVDANTELKKFCMETNWDKFRAVVFLDPFGNALKWETLESIASTKAIDLWYLFPAGLGVDRQIGRDGTIHYTHEASLDQLFGTREWRDVFVATNKSKDLFGHAENKASKTADPNSITTFMIQRMRQIFKGGVLDEWLPLGSRNIHMYSLVFAWANPSEKAKNLANKLAHAVLRA
jgi:three-Cys-motif partner protein